MLDRQQVRRFYDRFGAKQNWQRFYEGPAMQELLAQTQFQNAQAVFEFGCGTGYLARQLLAHHLPETATYLGYDLSATMVGLARQRLAGFGARARVEQTDGSVRLHQAEATFDRFISTYVLDLLPEADITTLLAEAWHLLRPGGRLGLVSLTQGHNNLSCLLVSGWEWLYKRRPGWVGGCRPVSLLKFVSEPAWQVNYNHIITSFGVPSEVVVASKSLME